MGLLDNLESGIERAVRTVFTGGGARKIKPVEIANALRTKMDRDAEVISQGRTLVPNIFTISFSPENFGQVRNWGTALAEELCDDAIRYARDQGYTLQGAVRVTFMEDEDVMRGDIKITSRVQATPAPQQAQYAPAATVPAAAPASAPVAAPAPTPSPAPVRLKPVLEVNGTKYAINSSSIVLGRASDADITLDDPGVSRKHLQIQVEGNPQDGVQRVVAIDLGSTNGFYLNNQKISQSATLRHGDTLTLGQTRIIFRMLPDRTQRPRPANGSPNAPTRGAR